MEKTSVGSTNAIGSSRLSSFPALWRHGAKRIARRRAVGPVTGMRDACDRLGECTLLKACSITQPDAIDRRYGEIFCHCPRQAHDTVLAIILARVGIARRTIGAQLLPPFTQAVSPLVTQDPVARLEVF